MEKPKIALLIFVLIAVKGLVFVFLIPPWQGPDEPFHFTIGSLFSDTSTPIQGVNSRILESLDKYRFWEYIEYTQPEKAVLGHHRKIVFPVYYSIIHKIFLFFGSSTLVGSMYLGRLFSLFIHMGTVFFIYLISRRLISPKEDVWFGIGVLAFAGFHPQWSFLSSVINTDNMISFLFAGITFCMVSIVTFPGSNGAKNRSIYLWWFFAILLTVLALLTKRTGVVGLLLVLLSALFLVPVRSTLRKTIILLFVFLMVSSIVYFLYEYNNQIRFVINKIFLRVIHQGLFKLRDVQDISPVLMSRFYLVQFVSFWFSLGWMIYKMSIAWYIIFGLISILSLGGLIRLIYARYARGGFKSVEMRVFFVLVLLMAISQIAMLFAYGPSPGSGLHDPMGRCRFMEIAAISILIPLGLWAISPHKRRDIVMKSLVCFMISLNVISVFKYVIPIFYL